MNLTQATDYAFRAVLYLARKGEGEVVEAQEIAGQERIPLRFLLKIMRLLGRAGIIKSFRGVGGGFALAKSPAEVTLLDVVEAVEGPIKINRCLIDPQYCSSQRSGRCAIHQELSLLQKDIIARLGTANFANILNREREL
ncbi:RrF2 family transcriptional regulator [Carboxydothermus pertinax]|uniref:Transcriptional regulator n=1 Tax=Carboxydothermus pertinax TaxID=870242 RepID=A0A1L8CV61_9THEO|nr:Rrf2 family transcriptional regulator [Carboxydothermus pertinax]GAV22777.1 transcriptional regulator [Carboxydothermus pertinax]